jgi:hypothetical protein
MQGARDGMVRRWTPTEIASEHRLDRLPYMRVYA